MSPNCSRSTGSTCDSTSFARFRPSLVLTILSNPENAPIPMNSMVEVSTVYDSPAPSMPDSARLPPFFAVTDTFVPSMSFNKACCTPSPPMSFVPENTCGFANLSISSSTMIPR
ncbi:hypothetical protein OGAPHI_000255 [Ogataea philodendri]|uniref:Uncharacterized protein n=1 Tax=Ogataea philodendri TaxID=1378263 RepID=A0A9P8PGC5_9ASCO|nr:uncharacterized protein OGAPHI_000255 [Ogataea philodendri]KAH3671552.1 hypothetical protein OGAPHI_000255 [Ogataea philodendri]